jgi:hypothetical protein
MSAPFPSKDRSSFRERMSKRPLRDVYQGSEDLWGYRAAAATLASFDVEELQPFQGIASPEVRPQLLVECDALSSNNARTRWSLRTPIRQTTLRRLFEEGTLNSALNANSNRESSATQRIFESSINLSSPAPAQPENLEDAAAMLEVSYWLDAIPTLKERMPSRDSIRWFIGREQLLEPFRNLVGNHFAGRQAELSALSDYVGVFAASGATEKVVRAFESIFSIVERPPLFVFGPGGAGKSTLIAKFVLDHAQQETFVQFPFAYLDFDRTALLAEEPVSLLFEIMWQLSAQYDQVTERYKSIVESWTSRIRAQKQEEEISDVVSDASDDAPEIVPLEKVESGASRRLNYYSSPSLINEVGVELRVQERESFLNEFTEFVQQLQPSGSNQPLLLVLDTFEEVQFRSSASEDDVLDFLAQLQQRIPRLRTVICGRAEIASTHYKVRELKIGNFDEPAALAFLKLLEIQKDDVAKAIFNQVGGNPLVLRLAADVAKKENVNEEGIEGLGSKWLEAFRSESVEVVLYKRILSHVYDQRIQRLAHPGLVLRYITPEVLLDVLGPACAVAIDGLADACILVKGMRQQLATILIPYGGTEKLTHRPDMRAILLADLSAQAKKDKVFASTLEQIRQKAVEYYAKSSDAESRAEEIYHRLSLQQDRTVLKKRWRDDAGSYLGSALRELPSSAQTFLAARTGFDVTEDVWDQAVEEDWILIASRRVRDLVRLGKPKDASRVLLKRTMVSGTALSEREYQAAVETVLTGYARLYEKVRKDNPSGNDRTRLMSSVVSEVRSLARSVRLEHSESEDFFARGNEGDRIVGLSLAQEKPGPNGISIAIEAIGSARTPFEQFQGLVLAELIKQISQNDVKKLREVLLAPKGVPFHSTDPSRTTRRDRLLKKYPDPRARMK